MKRIDFVDCGDSITIPLSDQSSLISIVDESDITLDVCTNCTDIFSIGGNSTNCDVNGTFIHNELQGLQGGDNTNRYHLNKDQWQAVIASNNPSVTNAFATLADLSGGSVTASNGLTKTENNIKLGGTVSEFTQIYSVSAAQPVVLTATDSVISPTTISFVGAVGGANPSVTMSSQDPTFADLSKQNNIVVAPSIGISITAGGGSNYTQFNLKQTDTTFTDNSLLKRGIMYFDDYESTFVARSLVTKQYSDGAFVNLTTDQNVAGNKTFTGYTNLQRTSILGGFVFDNGNEFFITSGFDLNFRAPSGDGRTILDGHDGYVSFTKIGYNDGTDGGISIYGNKITRTLDNAEVVWSTATSIVATLSEVDSVINGNQVAAWGDSMTNGLTAIPYPDVLERLLGTYVFNGGIAGETSGQIRTRFAADSTKWSWPTIIFSGRNNIGDIPGILADIAAMVASLGHNNYVIVSVFNTQNETNAGGPGSGYDSVISLNTQLLSTYGDHFVDARAAVVAAYNPSLPQDVIDHSNDCTPTSLRLPADVLHLNSAGNAIVANTIFSQKIQYLRNPLVTNKPLGVNEIYEVISKAPNVGSKVAGIGNFKDFNVQFVDAKNLFTVKSTDGVNNLLRIGPDNTAYMNLNQFTLGSSSNPGSNFGVVGSTANNSSTNTILANSAGTVLYLVRNDGAANIPNYLNVGSQTNVFTAKLFVKGLTSANANNTLQLQNSSGAIIANFRDDGLVSFDGTMQLRIPAIAGDAGFVTDRGIWYNSTSGQFRGRRNGATISFAANPMTSVGDIIVGGTSGAETRLAVGGANTILHGGTTPSYSAIATADIANNAVTYGKMQAMTANRLLGSALSGTAVTEITLGTNLSLTGTTLNAASGFTNPMTTLGDVIYGGAGGTATRLAGNTTTTRMFLSQTGTGTVSAPPAYFDLFNAFNTWNNDQFINGHNLTLYQTTPGLNGSLQFGDASGFAIVLQPDTSTKTFGSTYTFRNLLTPTNGGIVAVLEDIAVTNNTTTSLTLSTLNSTYPNATLGQMVICSSISGGGLIYVKAASTNWVTISAPLTT